MQNLLIWELPKSQKNDSVTPSLGPQTIWHPKFLREKVIQTKLTFGLWEFVCLSFCAVIYRFAKTQTILIKFIGK